LAPSSISVGILLSREWSPGANYSLLSCPRKGIWNILFREGKRGWLDCFHQMMHVGWAIPIPTWWPDSAWSHAPLLVLISRREAAKILLLKNLWHTTVISGFHEKKTAVLILPNTKSCGCGWTSPATTITNTHKSTPHVSRLSTLQDSPGVNGLQVATGQQWLPCCEEQ